VWWPWVSGVHEDEEDASRLWVVCVPFRLVDPREVANWGARGVVRVDEKIMIGRCVVLAPGIVEASIHRAPRQCCWVVPSLALCIPRTCCSWVGLVLRFHYCVFRTALQLFFDTWILQINLRGAIGMIQDAGVISSLNATTIQRGFDFTRRIP